MFPILGKIAEKSLELIGQKEFVDSAYSITTISTKKFKRLEKEGLAIAPKVVRELEDSKQDKIFTELVVVY